MLPMDPCCDLLNSVDVGCGITVDVASPAAVIFLLALYPAAA